MFERGGELEVLDRLLLAAGTGTGGAATVEGPMGIGKSRLLEEARDLAGRRRLTTLSGRGGELESDYPFGVVLQLFERHLLDLPTPERERALRGRAAGAAALVGGETGGDEFALLHALYWLVVNLAEQQPLAFFVDDLQWADEPSLRFLLYLVERLRDLPVALVGSIRTPRRPNATLERLQALGQPPLVLGELSLDGTRELLRAAGLPAADDEAAVRACHATTGGSPLLLQELVFTLLQDPELQATTDPAKIEALSPRALETRILPRIAGVGQTAVALARVAALLGDDARLTDAARIIGVALPDAAHTAEDLMDAAVLAESDPVRFWHPMMRSVVHASIAPGERRRLHAAAAEVLHERGEAAERVARHLIAGTPRDESWVAETLRAGALIAAQRGAAATATDYLRHAVEYVADARLRASIQVDLGLQEAAAGQTASVERLEAALEALDSSGPDRARALAALGHTLYRYGRHEEALATFRRGADLFADDRELALGFEAAWAVAGVWLAVLGPDAHPRLAEIAIDIDTEGELTSAERALLAALAAYGSAGHPPKDGPAELARLALGNGALLGGDQLHGLAAGLGILVLISMAEFDDAEREIALLFDDAQRRHDALAFADASMLRAYLRHTQGRIDEAMADAEAALEGVAHGWQVAPQMARGVLAQCHLERGDIEDAERVMAEVELADRGDFIADALLFETRARLRLLRNDAAGALEDCWAARAALDAANITHPHSTAVWRLPAARALHSQGDTAQAVALCDEALTVAAQWDLEGPQAVALRERSRSVAATPAVADLRLALSLLDGAGLKLQSARTRYELGLRLTELDELEAAREVLKEALAGAHACGALALEQQAREALVAAGGRPGRRAGDGLTPSERRIAEAAVAGQSNREIAESLFLTKNTVEWHLRRIFKKLDIKSRNELADALG